MPQRFKMAIFQQLLEDKQFGFAGQSNHIAQTPEPPVRRVTMAHGSSRQLTPTSWPRSVNQIDGYLPRCSRQTLRSNVASRLGVGLGLSGVECAWQTILRSNMAG
jgi:hypothetical protein